MSHISLSPAPKNDTRPSTTPGKWGLCWAAGNMEVYDEHVIYKDWGCHMPFPPNMPAMQKPIWWQFSWMIRVLCILWFRVFGPGDVLRHCWLSVRCNRLSATHALWKAQSTLQYDSNWIVYPLLWSSSDCPSSRANGQSNSSFSRAPVSRNIALPIYIYMQLSWRASHSHTSHVVIIKAKDTEGVISSKEGLGTTGTMLDMLDRSLQPFMAFMGLPANYEGRDGDIRMLRALKISSASAKETPAKLEAIANWSSEPCVYIVYIMCIYCVYIVYILCIYCVYIYIVYILCIYCVYIVYIYILCIYCIYCVYIVYILCIYCVYIVYILCIYCICILCIYCVYIVYILCIYCVYIVYILCIYCVYIAYILCIYLVFFLSLWKTGLILVAQGAVCINLPHKPMQEQV